MTRGVAAIVLVLGLSQAQLYAQDTVFTVTLSSADVHKGPSTVTPVIGHVSSGTAMAVQRNLGSWVKVNWPSAPDGVGYLHVTTGRLTSRNGGVPASTVAPAQGSPRTASASSAPKTARAAALPRAPRERVAVRSEDGTAITHVVGVGGLVGSMDNMGGTARLWPNDRLGLQISVTRDAMTSTAVTGRVSSMQVEPAIVYGLFDRVSDYFWIRPYVGSGVSIRHQSLQDVAPIGADAPSKTGMGVRVFGGAEASFAGAPRFALSVDAGYRKFQTPFPGFEPDRFAMSISGHWYVK